MKSRQPFIQDELVWWHVQINSEWQRVLGATPRHAALSRLRGLTTGIDPDMMIRVLRTPNSRECHQYLADEFLELDGDTLRLVQSINNLRSLADINPDHESSSTRQRGKRRVSVPLTHPPRTENGETVCHFCGLCRIYDPCEARKEWLRTVSRSGQDISATCHLPGTLGKVMVLADRYARGVQLWHPEDSVVLGEPSDEVE